MYKLIYTHSVFIGGYWPLQIESVLIMKSNHNLQKIITALWALDQLVSGQMVHVQGISVSLLCELVSLCVFQESKFEFDEYIVSTFNHFVQNKHTLILDLYNLDESDNKELVEFVMNEMKQQNTKKTALDLSVCVSEKEESNLCGERLLSIFNHAHTLTLITRSFYDHQYSFSWWSLLRLLCKSSITTVVVKARGNKSWLASWFEGDDEYLSERERIEKAYKENQFEFGPFKKEGEYGQCVIKKQNE